MLPIPEGSKLWNCLHAVHEFPAMATTLLAKYTTARVQEHNSAELGLKFAHILLAAIPLQAAR